MMAHLLVGLKADHLVRSRAVRRVPEMVEQMADHSVETLVVLLVV